MKARFPALTLQLVTLLFSLGVTTSAQITFTTTPARTGASVTQQGQQGQGQHGQQGQGQQGQQRQQGQKGLTPEKKKSLSQFGPEDAFPGAREQEEEVQTKTNRPAARPTSSPANPQPTSTPTPVPVPTYSVPPTPMPVVAIKPSPSPRQPVTATESPAHVTQPRPGRSWVSGIVPITLSTAALLVFGALIYVVGMLRKKLNEGDR